VQSRFVTASEIYYSRQNFLLIVKANEMYYFSNLFDKIFYVFRKRPLSIIRSMSTLCTRNRYLSW